MDFCTHLGENAVEKQEKKSFFKSTLFKTTVKIVVIVIVAVSLLLNLFTFVMPVVKYYGTSMSPTLEDEQILIVSKLSEIENGDIVAFYYNNKVLVRRVIASGSEQLTIDLFGTVSVNGQELSEPYAENKTLGQSNLSFPYSVPSNSYFVMGDNREAAMDSRLSEIGTVTKDRLIGKVVFSVSEFKPI